MNLNIIEDEPAALLDMKVAALLVMIYAELLSDGHLRMFSFDQEDMERFRLMIALSILNGEINYSL